ncbi:MAG: type II secretion system F family protein [Nitrososphaeria archaeon]
MNREEKMAIVSVVLPADLLAVTFYLKLNPYGMDFGFMLIAIILSALMPYGTARWLREREKSQIDRELLPLLSDMESYVKSGKDLMTSLIMAGERRKGPLKGRLTRVSSSIKIGMSPSDALSSLSTGMPTPLSKDIFLIMYRLLVYGGNIPEVVSSLRKNISSLHDIESEKKSIMRNYSSVIYISFLLLLFIDLILFRYFFLKMASTSISSPFGGQELNIAQVKSLLFQLSLIEGTISGIIAGKIGDGTAAAGVKHVIVMLVIAIVFFYLM